MEYVNNKLTISRNLAAPVEKVWEALTDSALIKQWSPFFPDFKPIIGYESRFLLGPDKDHQYMHICAIIEVIEHKKLTYSWEYEGYEGESFVTFNLSPNEDTTDVVFVHEILRPFPVTIDTNFSEKSFNEGWTYTLDALQKFVENK